MGCNCEYLALMAGITDGAETILLFTINWSILILVGYIAYGWKTHFCQVRYETLV